MSKKGKFRTESGAKEEMPKAKLNAESLKRTSRLFSYMGKHKWKFYLGMFFLLCTGATALIFPMLLGKLMGLIGGQEGQTVTKDSLNALAPNITEDTLLQAANRFGLWIILLLSAQAIASFFRVYFFENATQHMLASLRLNTFSHLMRLPMTFFSKNMAAELNSRISADITQIGETFTTALAEFFRQFIIVVGGIIIIAYTSWKLALVMMCVVPPVAIFAMVFGRKIRGIAKQLQEHIGESNLIVGESLQGIANVKAFTNEGYEAKRYNTVAEKVIAAAMRNARARGMFFAFIIFFLFGSIMLMVWFGVRLKVSGDITSEQMVQFLMMTMFVAASIGGLPEQYAQIQRAIGAADRVFDILNESPEIINIQADRQRSSLKLKGEVEFSGVAFSYPTRKDYTVLQDVSFSVTQGQTIALVGHSGSGKSTMAGMLMRFYNPDSGTITIDGKNVSDYDLTALRENMAIVPQDVLLFGGTIAENIAYGRPGASMEEIVAAARQANALTFIESFPDKFETKVGDRGIQLSGGQRQRIAIARAVLKDPSILILDEATSSLDSESERVVQEALDKLMVGRTSFVIAHRLSTIRNADKIVVLEKGVVAEAGTHEELMQIKDGVYRSLNNLQFQDSPAPLV
jgi:ABC-type multidrug transport system fused ATPase/permease subunit